jgi:hypothetical protein
MIGRAAYLIGTPVWKGTVSMNGTTSAEWMPWT